MSRTVTALFDSRPEAEAARTRLTQSRIDADNVRIIDQSASGGGGGSGGEDKGFFDSLKDFFIPDEDAHAYGEGVRRGGFMLCAQVDEDQADEAIRILDEGGSVDFDQRQEQWRNDGWTGFGGMTDTGVPSGAGMGGSGLGSEFERGTFAGSERGPDAARFENERGTVDEQRFPIVEEAFKVGKREVTRGGARVRSYVRETPVHEQVNLREEHVSVERRPADRKLEAGEDNDAFRDRTIEMTETSEEAVVEKDARVREELVVRKTADQRVENIDDSVRRTEVEVDETEGREDRPAFGGFKDEPPDSARQRSDFERTDKGRF